METSWGSTGLGVGLPSHKPPIYSPTSSKDVGHLSVVAQKQKPLHNGISMYALCLRGPVNKVDSSNIAMTEIHLGEESR